MVTLLMISIVLAAVLAVWVVVVLVRLQATRRKFRADTRRLRTLKLAGVLKGADPKGHIYARRKYGKGANYAVVLTTIDGAEVTIQINPSTGKLEVILPSALLIAVSQAINGHWRGESVTLTPF